MSYISYHIWHIYIKIKYNPEQKIVDKFKKLSKADFSMDCLTIDFLRFFSKNVKNCL